MQTLTKKEVVERINQFCIEDLENIKQFIYNSIYNSIYLIIKFQDEYGTYIELTELYPEYDIFSETINELLDEIKDNDEACGILQYPDSKLICNNKFIRIVTYGPIFIVFRFEKGEKE